MQPTYTIVDIYETPARARVLRALALSEGPMSVRGIGRAADVSHTTAAKTLRDLDSMGLVSGFKVGRAISYSLLDHNAYVRHMVLPMIESERTVIEELRANLIEAFAEHVVSLILFGSYAYGGQSEASDIDVFALVEDEFHRQAVEEDELAWSKVFSERYGAPLSLLIHTLPEARAALRIGESAFRIELESTGIILHGLGPSEWGIDEPEKIDARGSTG